MSDPFGDALLSPDKEEAPVEGDLLRVKSSEAMENIQLETTPVDEKTVAAGVQALSLEEKSPDISQYFLAEETQNDPFDMLATKEESKPDDPPAGNDGMSGDNVDIKISESAGGDKLKEPSEYEKPLETSTPETTATESNLQQIPTLSEYATPASPIVKRLSLYHLKNPKEMV